MYQPPLKGRIALVTGSTSGIGLAIARRLAREGAEVVLHGLGTPEQIEEAIAAVEAAGGTRPRHFDGDLADPAAPAGLIAAAEEAFGRIDILVNNAGIQFTAPVVDFPLERWNAILAVNLTAPFLATQAVLPGMLARNWGRIINTASISGLSCAPFKAAYTASKHGLLGLTKVVALETAKTGVTCNAVCPGWVLTPLVEKQIHDLAAKNGTTYEEAKAAMARDIPSGNFVTPDQIGGYVAFLCSPDADEVRGTGLNMDSGILRR